MPTTPRTSRFLAALSVVLASACSNSLAPGELGDEYTLISVAGDVLPTALYTTEVGTLRGLSQSIRFGPTGTGSITETTELVPAESGAPGAGPTQTTLGFHWAEVSGRVEITYDCPPNANCAAGPHLIARVDGHALGVTWGRQTSGRSPLRYEEVMAAQ
jgi:hypothetical protein